MFRVEELRELSRDHHGALVLARSARNAAAGKDGLTADEQWPLVEANFEAVLEPHFKVEEELMAPVMVAHGKADLAAQQLREHAEIRKLLASDSERSAANLMRFGELLEQHVRFEERELFELAQDIMTPEELGAIAKASDKGRGK